MTDLGKLLTDTMRRQRLSVHALADRTGIRHPRIKSFTQDGDSGPIRPTTQELAELADALSLELPRVQDAGAGPHP